MQAQLEIILPVFVVISFGYIAVWRGLFSEESVDGIVSFAQNFAIPCLLFRAISEIDIFGSFSVPLIVSYYLGAFTSFVVGYAGARVLFKRDPVDATAIAFCCLFSNTVLLGIPITERAYGSDGLTGNYAIIALHAPLCYVLGVTAMETARDRSTSIGERLALVLRALIRNPFVVAILLGFIVNIMSIQLPLPLIKSLDLLSQTALPIALFGLGGVLVSFRVEGDSKIILMICSISLFLHPAIVFFAGKALHLDQAALRSAVLTASMAPGVNTYVFANMYNASRRVTASSVLVATAASIFTIWIWLQLLP